MYITIAICTYNRSKDLNECIISLLENNYYKEKYEILVVDNNSVDNTYDIVMSLAKDNSNIRYVKETNVGLSNARNRAISEAKGDVLAFVDDDVIVNDKYLYNISKHFSDKDIVCSGGKIIPIWGMEKPSWFTCDFASIIGETLYGEKERVFKNREYPLGGNMIFKTSIFQKVGGFNSELGLKGNKLILGEEIELCDKINSLGYDVFYLPDVVVNHKVHIEKVNKEYMFKRMIHEGESVALWHYEDKSNLMLGKIKRYLILFCRDYPLYLFNFFGNKRFSKKCKIERSKAYINKINMLIK